MDDPEGTDPQPDDEQARLPWQHADDELDESDPDATPPRPSPGSREVPGAPGFEYAGVLRRSAAYAIDLAIVVVLSIVGLSLFIAVAIGVPEPGDTTLSLAAWTGMAVIAELYFVGFWTTGRRGTPGMRLLRLMIVRDSTNEPLGVVRSAVRVVALGIATWPLVAVPALNLVGGLIVLVWPLVLLASAVIGAQGRGLHDRLVGKRAA